MTSTEHREEQPAGAVVAFLTRPQVVAWTGIACLVAAGWLWIGLMVADMVPRLDMGEAGPGMSLFNAFGEGGGLGRLGVDLLRSICRVDTGLASGQFTWAGAGVVLVMWLAMALAMMVPTAAPMITTYAEIAQTAREKRVAVVSPLVLLAGYLSVWAVFCLLAAAMQMTLAKVALLTPGFVIASPWLGAGILVMAGLYQLSAFKAACLAKCRTPMPFFFANWSDRAGGVFRMGVRQGLDCLACCWVLMLVMFAAGLMNVIWIAVLTVVMLLEKVSPRPELVVKGTGVVCFVWAAGLFGGAMV